MLLSVWLHVCQFILHCNMCHVLCHLPIKFFLLFCRKRNLLLPILHSWCDRSTSKPSSAPKKMIRYLLRFASLVSLPICFASIVDLANSETNSEIIYSVVSGSAHLPCNVSPPQGSNDEPRLILWYKDSDPQPVYSFDNRYTNPKHWSQVLQFLIILYLKVAKSQSWEVGHYRKMYIACPRTFEKLLLPFKFRNSNIPDKNSKLVL